MTRLYYTLFSSLFLMNKRKEVRGKGIFSKLTLDASGKLYIPDYGNRFIYIFKS